MGQCCASGIPSQDKYKVKQPPRASKSVDVDRQNIIANNKKKKKTSAKFSPNDVHYEELKTIVGIPFFEDFGTDQAKSLHKLFTRKELPAGSIVCEEGKEITIFHVVVAGRLRMTARDTNGESIQLRILNKGEWFGDFQMSANGIQPVTVTCLSECTLLGLPVERFMKMVGQYPELSVSVMSTMDPVQVQLASIPFFQGVSELKLQQLAALQRILKVPGGEVICQQGDQAYGFYYIISGRVDISAQGPKNESVHLDTLTEGNWFGEIALIEDVSRTATVTSTQDTLVMYLDREHFQQFLRLAPEVSDSFQSMILKRTANSLKAIPLFNVYRTKRVGPMQVFEASKLQLLGELFRFVQFRQDAVVYREGDDGDAFYIMVSGKCKMQASTPSGGPIVLGEFCEGDWFGDVNLLYNGRRTATVIASVDCTMLRLGKEHFVRFLHIVPEIESLFRARVGVRTAARLKEIPFFRDIKENRPWSKLDLLGNLFRFETFETGDDIFHEGDKGEKFYIVVEGRLKVMVNRGGDDDLMIDRLREGQWFGEIALLMDTPRTATIRCAEKCLLLTISAPMFKKFLHVAPELSEPFMSMLQQRTANTLKYIDLFKLVKENKPWSKMELLAGLFNYEQFGPRQIIYSFGDEAEKFYLIVKGLVDIVGHNSEGLFVKTPTLTDHDHFGEDSLLTNTLRETSATTITSTVCLCLSRAAFRQFLRICPEVRPYFVEVINKRRQLLQLDDIDVDIGDYIRKSVSMSISPSVVENK